MANTEFKQGVLRPPKAPNLLIAPVDYTQTYQDQMNNALRLYFNQIDNFGFGLTNSQNGGGGALLSYPYGSFYDTTTQTAASTTTAYPITINTTAYSNTVTISNGSHINFRLAGLYNVQFSAQLANLDNAPQDIDIWFRQNGTDIPNSNSRFGVPARKSAGVPFHFIQTVNLYIRVNAGDYVELVWCTSNVAANIDAYVAGVTPTRPAVPSMIVTAQFVSA